MSGVHPRDVCTSTYLQEARSARYGSAAAQSSRRWSESDMFSPVVSHWVNGGPDNSPRLLLFSSSARRRLFNSLWTLDEAAVSTRRSKPPLPRGQDGGLHGRNTAAGPSTALQPARFPQVRSLALHRRNLAGLAVRDPVRTASPFHNADDSTPAGNPRRTPRPLVQTVPCHREATTSRSQYSMSATVSAYMSVKAPCNRGSSEDGKDISLEHGDSDSDSDSLPPSSVYLSARRI